MTTPPTTELPSPCTSERDIARAGEPALRVRLYGRRPPGGSAPLVLHFHGGAFTGGSLDAGARIAGLLAEAGAVVASVDYPLAPAHPFPHGADAGYGALRWLQRQRKRLGGPDATLWVAGEEAGGNLAAAVAMMARDRQEPELAGQILLSPMIDPCIATASLRDVAAGPVGCRYADGWRAYLPRAADADHPYAAPAASRRLAGLPRTLLLTADDDPLRDETVAFGRRLRAAGVTVEQEVLARPTDWPCACLETPQCDAPWSAPVRARLRSFLTTGEAPKPDAGAGAELHAVEGAR